MGYEMDEVYMEEETGISQDLNSTRVPLFTHGIQIYLPFAYL